MFFISSKSGLASEIVIAVITDCPINKAMTGTLTTVGKSKKYKVND